MVAGEYVVAAVAGGGEEVHTEGLQKVQGSLEFFLHMSEKSSTFAAALQK